MPSILSREDQGILPYSLTVMVTHVNRFGKTLRNELFLKIEFDIWLISTTIKYRRALGRSRASLLRFSALFTIAPHSQSSRHIGLNTLLCTHMAFPYTIRELEMVLGGLFEMNIKVKKGSNFVVKNDSRLFLDAQKA